MKSISGFMAEVSDELRIGTLHRIIHPDYHHHHHHLPSLLPSPSPSLSVAVLVDAIRMLCLKFPHKHMTLMSFLSSVLREEGGLEYKTSIVNAILALMDNIDDAKESGLEHLCEFIEDCEFPSLSVKVLYVLGEQGPR